MTQEKAIVTYVDACLLIVAFRDEHHLNEQARNVLKDKRRSFLVSDALWLELLPKAVYNKRVREAEFYERFFARAQRLPTTEAVIQRACMLAARYGLAAMDAVHIAHAVEAGADEFISAESLTKPMFRVLDVPMLSIADEE